MYLLSSAQNFRHFLNESIILNETKYMKVMRLCAVRNAYRYQADWLGHPSYFPVNRSLTVSEILCFFSFGFFAGKDQNIWKQKTRVNICVPQLSSVRLRLKMKRTSHVWNYYIILFKQKMSRGPHIKSCMTLSEWKIVYILLAYRSRQVDLSLAAICNHILHIRQ